MANPIRVVTVPRDASVPSTGIAAADWSQAQTDIALANTTAANAELYAAVANNLYYNVMNPARGPVAAGDGVTDDWAAIQHRLDNMPTSPDSARGGKVVLEPGHTYAISQTLTITLPNTDLDGIVGGTLTTMGSTTIKALPGFTGPLIRISIPSGNKGAWIRNLKLDGSSEPGVTAGIEYGGGTISVAHLFDIAIAYTNVGIKTNRNCQSVIWDRVIAMFGMTIGADIGPDMRHVVANECRFGGSEFGVVVGPDNNVNADSVETAIFNNCEIYLTSGANPTNAVLIRNAENPRFTNCYIEVSGAVAAPVNAVVQIGTANAIARTPTVTGCRLGGNLKAQFGVEIQNAYYAFVAFNGSDTSLLQGTLNNINAQVSLRRRGFLMGGAGNIPDRHMHTEINELPSGVDAFQARVDGDADARLAIRAGASPSIMFGNGSTSPDIVLYRYLSNVLGLAGGDSFRLDGSWNGGHIHMGNYRLWVDATGKLRIKNGAPTSDTDGTAVGSQT